MDHKGRSLISASAVFLTLLFPLRLPQFFWPILFFSAFLAAMMVFWVFGEKPSFKRFKEDWFTIVFIFVFAGSMGTFSYLVPNPLVQALLLGATGSFVYFFYQVASRLKRNYTPSLFLRNITSLGALLGIFFSVSNALKWMTVSEATWAPLVMMVMVFALVFVISEFLFEAQGFEKSLLYSLVISFGLTQLVWLSSYWLINYPDSIKATNIGVPLPAILATIFYYLSWGLSHHRLEGSLSKKVLWEYLFISIIFVVILFSTAKWLP